MLIRTSVKFYLTLINDHYWNKKLLRHYILIKYKKGAVKTLQIY